MADVRVTLQVLRVLQSLIEEGPSYGSALIKSARLASGSLYPILDRLERAGVIEGAWEQVDAKELGRPRRRTYSFTPTGRSWAISEVRAAQQSLAPRRVAWGTT